MYNPATGRNELLMLSTADEVAMGKSIQQTIDRQYRLSNDPVQLERVRRIGARLAKVSDRQDYTYHFFVIKKDDMNAFTVPGGNIYIFSGLLEKLKTDDEVAAVLAHEIGHCAARHTAKKFQAALGYDIISNIVLSQIAGAQAKQITSLSSGAVMNIVFSAYGRKDEYQADELGVKYMYLACYDPHAMMDTFNILKKAASGPVVPVILRTHPFLDDRIKVVREEIPALPAQYGKNTCPQGLAGPAQP